MTRLVLILVLGVAQPDAGAPDPGQIFADIQRSHIDGNVPDAPDFDRFLRRDRGSFLQGSQETRRPRRVRVAARWPNTVGRQFLRVISGSRVAGGENSRGPRGRSVAAVEKKRFEVLTFISEESFRRDPTVLCRRGPPRRFAIGSGEGQSVSVRSAEYGRHMKGG